MRKMLESLINEITSVMETGKLANKTLTDIQENYAIWNPSRTAHNDKNTKYSQNYKTDTITQNDIH